MPSKYRNAKDPNGKKKPLPKGVSNRNKAIKVILEHAKQDPQKAKKSVLYFADDDNTYDLQLFEEIRQTKRVSVFPVGLIGPQIVSSPVVVDNGSVVDFHDVYRVKKRKFLMDMAGFAVNVEFLMQVCFVTYAAHMSTVHLVINQTFDN